MLPHRAQAFLDVDAVGHLAYLLKLVDAHHNAPTTPLSHSLRQLQHLLGGVRMRCDAQAERELRERFGREADFRHQP